MKPTRSASSIAVHQAMIWAEGRSQFRNALRTTFRRKRPTALIARQTAGLVETINRDLRRNQARTVM